MCNPRGLLYLNFRKTLAFQIDITEPALADVDDYVQFIREVGKEPEAG